MNVNTKELQTQLSRLVGVVHARTTLPVLECVLIHGGTLLASNLDQYASTQIRISGEEPVNTCVSCKRLLSIVKSMTGPEITLKQDGTYLNISSGDSKFRLPTINADEFPPAPPLSGDEVTMPSESLRMGLESVFRSASGDESRFVMNGVLAEISGNQMQFVATDGRRLSKNGSMAEYKKQAIMPNPTVGILRGLLGEYENVSLTMSERAVRFVFSSGEETFTLFSKLVEGKFPNWRQVIPKNTGDCYTLNRENLINAVRRVNLVGDKEIHMTLSFGDEMLKVSKSTTEGDAEDTVSYPEKTPGGGGDISIKAEFLLDSIGSIPENNVTLEYRSELEPLLVKSGDILHVIMPVRKS